MPAHGPCPPRSWWLADIHQVCARTRPRQETEESRQLLRSSASLLHKPSSVVVRGIAVHGVDMLAGIPPKGLWRILDDKMRTLDAVIGRNVFARSHRSRSAPGEPGLVDIGP